MDIEQVATRTSESLSYSLTDCCRRITQQLAPYCESEIEAMLGCALIVGLRLDGSLSGSILAVAAQELMDKSTSQLTLVPQYKWNDYRIDWAVHVRGTDSLVFIECDGHDFHERTKEQAERDRRKDRLIQQAGIPIMRFTGREIFRSPVSCAIQILDFISARTPKKGPQE